jgi:hypothetical protein
MTDTRTDRLLTARRQASRDKHAHALRALDQLVRSGTRITYARVAREAGVSTWLLYNQPELTTAIRDAMAQQSPPRHPPGPLTSGDSLRTDLELARHEIAALRTSERKLRERLQRTLGNEIEQIDHSQLAARIADLEALVANLRVDNAQLRETNPRLVELTDQQRDDLETANILLRRYMKEASRSHP